MRDTLSCVWPDAFIHMNISMVIHMNISFPYLYMHSCEICIHERYVFMCMTRRIHTHEFLNGHTHEFLNGHTHEYLNPISRYAFMRDTHSCEIRIHARYAFMCMTRRIPICDKTHSKKKMALQKVLRGVMVLLRASWGAEECSLQYIVNTEYIWYIYINDIPECNDDSWTNGRVLNSFDKL